MIDRTIKIYAITVPEVTSSDITIEYHLQDDSDSYSPENHLLASIGRTFDHVNVRKINAVY